MKKAFLTTSLMILATVSVINAQDNIYAEQRIRESQREKATLQKAVRDSPAAELLNLKVIKGETKAILEAAATGDQSLIPYFKLLAEKKKVRSYPESAAFNAHVALLKFGDETALSEVDEEIKDPNPFIQDGAIKKLAIAGTKKSFHRLYELLDDVKERKPNSQPSEDEVYSPNNAVVTMYELAEVVDDPPVKKNTVPNIKDIPLWKEWFGRNKHLID